MPGSPSAAPPETRAGAGPEDRLETLIERCALGDRAAFELLYRHSSAKLFGVCLRILGNRSEAEEALQETYIKIWRNAGQYARTRARPLSWLAAIARNQSIDRLRARRPQADSVDVAAEIAGDEPSPEASALAADERRRLQDCLETLSAQQATAIRRSYFGDLTYEALAAQMSVPLGTMKSWIRRGLIRLKACLEQ